MKNNSKEVIVSLVSGRIRVYPEGLGGFKYVPSYVTTWEQYHADKKAKAEEKKRFEQAFDKTIREVFPELMELLDQYE